MNLTQITSDEIRKLEPCLSGIKNFEANYPSFCGKLTELLKLDNVPFSDKMWLCGKVLPEKIAQVWSLECAKSVAHNYKKVFPNDNTLDKVFVTIEKVIAGELHPGAAWSAASAAKSAAESAAWSAAWSAASAAKSAASAAWSAASAAKSAAESAAWSAESAASSEKEQNDYNLMLLITILESEGL